MSLFFPSPYSSLPIILVKVNIGFISPKKLCRLFQMFPGKVYLAFLFFSVNNGLYLVEHILCFHSWRRVLIVDCDNYIPISWRVILTWLDTVKGFLVHQGNNSAIIKFSCLLVILTVDLATPKLSVMFVLFYQPNDGVLLLFQHIFGPDIKGYHEQLPNAK